MLYILESLSLTDSLAYCFFQECLSHIDRSLNKSQLDAIHSVLNLEMQSVSGCAVCFTGVCMNVYMYNGTCL